MAKNDVGQNVVPIRMNKAAQAAFFHVGNDAALLRQADGTYEKPGVTAGFYLVQAIADNIAMPDNQRRTTTWVPTRTRL